MFFVCVFGLSCTSQCHSPPHRRRRHHHHHRYESMYMATRCNRIEATMKYATRNIYLCITLHSISGTSNKSA